MKCPSIIDVREIVKNSLENSCGITDKRGATVWVPARAQWSIDSPITRVRAVWLVLTGKADAVTWPGQ